MNRPKYVEKKESDGQEEQRNTNSQYNQRNTGERRTYNSGRNNDGYYKKPQYVQKGTRDNEEHSDEERRDNRRNNNYNPRYKKNAYERDESKIAYYTELPVVPEVRRKKPNHDDHLERIEKIDNKKNELKDLRRQEKDSIKNKQSGAFKRLQDVKDKIDIGQRAEKTLANDLKDVEAELDGLNEKISGLETIVSKLQKKTSRNVDVENMTLRQLESYIKKLEHKITTQTLEKKQISELRGEIEKCKRLKIVNKNTQDVEEKNKQDILREREQKLESLKDIKKRLKNKKHEIEVKIRKTENDLEDLYESKASVEEEKEEFKNSPEYEKTKHIKDEILQLREEKDRELERYEKALNAYEEEEKLIQYVAWATEIKKRKLEEKEQDRAERQKQKIRAGKKDGKKDENEGETKFERPPPPHPYAKEIGFCNFLIQYVEKLKPAQNQKVENTTATERPEVNVEQEIKKGVWAKEKGIQVIVSKKKVNVDEAPEKKQSRLREKGTKQVESNEITHNLEIERIFEQVKLTAPKARDVKSLEETITKLNEKKDYYQNNFSASERQPERPYEQDKRPKYKYEQKGGSGGNKKEKLNLQLSDFPTLS